MGLDSVELLVSFEDYFNIQVSDQEAEKIRTVQEMVDCVARHLSVTENGDAMQQAQFEKVKTQFLELGFAAEDLKPTDKIAAVLGPKVEESFSLLSEKLGLNIPRPIVSSDSIINRVFRKIAWQPRYDWGTLSLEQFVTVVYANNYQIIIDSTAIKNKYEILIAVAAITANKLGLDLYEVQPEKSFTSDFGMD